MKAKWHSLQYSAGFFVLEGIVWGRDAHKQRVVSGVFAAVVHKVCGGLGYLKTMWDTERDVSGTNDLSLSLTGRNLRVSQAVSGAHARYSQVGMFRHDQTLDTDEMYAREPIPPSHRACTHTEPLR